MTFHLFLNAPPDNLRAHSWSFECSSASAPGFRVLQGLLVRHCHLPQVYEALAALLLGQTADHTAAGKVGPFFSLSVVCLSYAYLHCVLVVDGLQRNLDDVLQSLIDSQEDAPAPQLSVEAATILLELVKVIITQVRHSLICSHMFSSSTNSICRMCCVC